MKTRLLCSFVALAIFAGVNQLEAATVFPVATNANLTEISGGIAYGGTNYLVSMISGSASAGTNACFQLLSTNGSLVGSLTTVGHTAGRSGFESGGGAAFPFVGFNGSNYLVLWYDFGAATGYGQIVSSNGIVRGSAFAVGSTTNFVPQAVASDHTNFLVVLENYNRDFYGQFVTGGGSLSGSPFLISGQAGNGTAAAAVFGRTNYLVIWSSQNVANSGNTNLTFGALVSKSGSVSGPIQISDTPGPDQDPMNAAFDGTNYLAVWMWDPYPETSGNVTNWEIFGRLISQGGTFPGNELHLVSDFGNDIFPSVAFDGSHYLLSWGYGFDLTTNTTIRFRFFDRAGNALGSEFSVFTRQGTNAPIIADNGLVFNGKEYAAAGTLGNYSGNGGFSSGEVYGAIISTNVISAPVLAIILSGANVILTWPTNTPGYTLEGNANLEGGAWNVVLPTPSVVNGQFTVTNSIAGKQQFYLLSP